MYLNEQRRSRIQMVYSYQEHRKESQVPDQKIEEHVGQIILNQLGPSKGTCVSKRQVLATKHRCLVKRQDEKARGKVGTVAASSMVAKGAISMSLEITT